eukprot:s2706_g7.t1
MRRSRHHEASCIARKLAASMNLQHCPHCWPTWVSLPPFSSIMCRRCGNICCAAKEKIASPGSPRRHWGFDYRAF